MPDVQVGDRVRVRNTPRTMLDAGKTGTVLWVKEYPVLAVVICQVRLDLEPNVYPVFGAHELEPEPHNVP
jgi:hypothetical protein